MRIGITGSEAAFTERLDRAIAPGTTLVPCTVDDVTRDPGDLHAIVIGPSVPVQDALRVAQTIDSTSPEVGVVLIADPHPKVLRAALLAGARDVWSPDIDDHDLQQSLSRVMAVTARRKDAVSAVTAAPVRPSSNHVIVVLSPKGGAGKTTVAANLAFGVATATDGPVALVDLDLQFGDVATALSLSPDKTIADAAKAPLNGTAIKTSLAAHPSGVHALCAPANPVEADAISPEATGQLIDTLALEFSTVIVDTSAGLDEHTLGALDRATDLVVVSTTDIFAINGTRKLLDILEEIDIGEPDRHLVLNRANARVDIERPEIENTLNWHVDVEIPSTRAVPLAMNRGQSLYDAGRVARKPMLELLSRFVEPAAAKSGRRNFR